MPRILTIEAVGPAVSAAAWTSDRPAPHRSKSPHRAVMGKAVAPCGTSAPTHRAMALEGCRSSCSTSSINCPMQARHATEWLSTRASLRPSETSRACQSRRSTGGVGTGEFGDPVQQAPFAAAQPGAWPAIGGPTHSTAPGHRVRSIRWASRRSHATAGAPLPGTPWSAFSRGCQTCFAESASAVQRPRRITRDPQGSWAS